MGQPSSTPLPQAASPRPVGQPSAAGPYWKEGGRESPMPPVRSSGGGSSVWQSVPWDPASEWAPSARTSCGRRERAGGAPASRPPQQGAGCTATPGCLVELLTHPRDHTAIKAGQPGVVVRDLLLDHPGGRCICEAVAATLSQGRWLDSPGLSSSPEQQDRGDHVVKGSLAVISDAPMSAAKAPFLAGLQP